MKILLTGATGFIGRALLDELMQRNNNVVAAVRSEKSNLPENVLQVKINDLFELKNSESMCDVDVVIHCAARAHVLREHAIDPLIEFRKTNTVGTLNLARQAIAQCGMQSDFPTTLIKELKEHESFIDGSRNLRFNGKQKKAMVFDTAVLDRG